MYTLRSCFLNHLSSIYFSRSKKFDLQRNLRKKSVWMYCEPGIYMCNYLDPQKFLSKKDAFETLLINYESNNKNLYTKSHVSHAKSLACYIGLSIFFCHIKTGLRKTGVVLCHSQHSHVQLHHRGCFSVIFRHEKTFILFSKIGYCCLLYNF